MNIVVHLQVLLPATMISEMHESKRSAFSKNLCFDLWAPEADEQLAPASTHRSWHVVTVIWVPPEHLRYILSTPRLRYNYKTIWGSSHSGLAATWRVGWTSACQPQKSVLKGGDLASLTFSQKTACINFWRFLEHEFAYRQDLTSDVNESHKRLLVSTQHFGCATRFPFPFMQYKRLSEVKWEG